MHSTILFFFQKSALLLLSSLFIFFLGCSDNEREVVRFTIESPKRFNQPVPVSLILEDFLENNPNNLMLSQNGTPVPFQLENGKLWFTHNPSKGASYTFEEATEEQGSALALNTTKNNGNLQLVLNDNPVISYRYEMTYPPKGIDSLFAKSGFVHPIRTPKGDTLSRIQPPDHYHHYGLWGPWTHTRIDTTLVDFWNLGEGMGTVLFKEFKNTSSGNVFASFIASQEHIDLKTTEKPQVAFNEELEIKLWNLNRSDRYMFDYNTVFNSPLNEGILFEAYRYGGGIGLRFNERWKADNCTVLTSEGKDRMSADGTNAKWCIVSGESSDGGTNGILFMSHPNNRMHPEPMRIWPIDANEGRGDMFFEFCPIRHKAWKIEANKDYQLNYRMVVFDGELKAGEAEAYWQTFANRPEVIKLEN